MFCDFVLVVTVFLTACIATILEESFNYHLEGVSLYDHVVLVVGAISIKHRELPFLSIAGPVIRDQPHPFSR